ncbi:MAG: hypothetical protein Q8O88_06390 [bacterium]|nr:hypothetical protein [bacterium]
MPEDEDLSRHEEVAKAEARDDKGHFIHAEKPFPEHPLGSPESQTEEAQPHQNPVSKFLSDHTHYSKTQDDILDVHIGNPLRRIVLLLQELKQQKALSVSAKMSFGITGVMVVAGLFSVFGASNVLCSKGIQSQIGVIKVLNIEDKTSSALPVVGSIIDWFSKTALTSPTAHNRIVLIKNDNSAIRLPFSKNLKFKQYQNLSVIVTGSYDVCNQTLTVNDPSGLETLQK